MINIIANDRTTIFAIAIATNNFIPHFMYVFSSTLAAPRPPITTPDVGVKRLINPQPAQKILIIIEALNPNVFAKPPITGIENPASPDVEGTKKLNTK